MPGGGHATPIEKLTEEQIDSELSINIKGVVLTVQSVLGILRDEASVILNASITADMGLPGFAVYAATKAAVVHLREAGRPTSRAEGSELTRSAQGWC